MPTDIFSRLHSSLGDRYRVDRELGRGGMATVGESLRRRIRREGPLPLEEAH
jgi:hypothetical protein